MNAENTTTLDDSSDDNKVKTGSILDELFNFKYGNYYTIHTKDYDLEESVIQNLSKMFWENKHVTNIVRVQEFCEGHRTIDDLTEYALDLSLWNEGYEDKPELKFYFTDVVFVQGLEAICGNDSSYSTEQMNAKKQEFIDECLPKCGIIIFMQPYSLTENGYGVRSFIEKNHDFMVTSDEDYNMDVLRMFPNDDGSITVCNFPESQES